MTTTNTATFSINSSSLSWDGKSKTFLGDASKMGINGVVPSEVEIISAKTGGRKTFILMEEGGESIRYTDETEGEIDLLVTRDNNMTVVTPIVVPVAPVVVELPAPVVVEAPKPEPKLTPSTPATGGSGHCYTSEQVKQAKHLKCVVLTYKIPTTKNEDVPNPSPRLRRIGFRIDGSVWVIPVSRTPHSLLELFEANKAPAGRPAKEGVVHHVIDFDPNASDKLHQMAREAIEEETSRLHGSVINTIASADEQLKQALAKEGATSKDQDKAKAYRGYRVKAALKAAGEALDDAIECAMVFDEHMHVEDMFASLRKALASLRMSAGV